VPDPKRIVADVAIVGTGGAGLAAAIEARGTGAKVAIVERAETMGGASLVSGGGCCMAGTPLQSSKGIYDTPDQAFQDWVAWGGGAAYEPWARFYLEHSLHELYLWAEQLGVQWQGLPSERGECEER
jgi:succinate dehydrogenase/fumarate reductase flavoprotein subunit